MAQKDTNPYRYSDSNKRYMTYDWYMKARFGGKTAKVSLDIGCTCPNLDGSRGHGGCIYCKSGSRSAVGDTMDEQWRTGVETACRKWTPVGFIPYLQSNTNTYGDPAVLRGFYDGLSENTGQGSIESLLYETADRFCRAQYPNPKIAKSANANPVKQKPADRVIFWPVFLLLIILNCGCLWVIAGLLMDMGILPVIDLGYSWFHMNVFPWFW